MPRGFLTENCKITQVATVTAGAAAATDITSSAIDMAGWDGCIFIVPFGAIVAGAVTSVKVQQCDTSGGSYADLENTGVTVADDGDDTTKFVDVQRPREQFLKCVVDRGTQNATVGGIIAIQYRARGPKSTTQGSAVAGERHYAPAEGTP